MFSSPWLSGSGKFVQNILLFSETICELFVISWDGVFFSNDFPLIEAENDEVSLIIQGLSLPLREAAAVRGLGVT